LDENSKLRNLKPLAFVLEETFKTVESEQCSVVKAHPMSEMIRSFLAFDLNNETMLQRFKEVQDMLVKAGADLKLVEPQNIHITMRFLGDIKPAMVDLIHEAMKKVPFSAFNCEIRGLGAFPDLRYARVVWAGIREGAEELKAVFNQLEPNLQKLGFRPDSKGFSPHLTLARVRTGRNKAELARCVQDLAEYDFGVVKADCLRLRKSTLTPHGPIYSTLREVCH
jgi:2'-5' RNA ligase